VSEYGLTFGSVADDYERARPSYADDALAWLAGRLPVARVLDLAAGTGKLTRQLVALGASVVAVEPDDAMRATFERVVPGVEVLAGSAEAIPLADASVDAIFVGQAFHWFRSEAALAEMHRVVRPGGGFGLLWNTWHDDDPVLGRIDVLLDEIRPVEAARRRRGRFETDLFGPREQRSFRQARTLTTDAIVAWVASTSAVFNAPEPERAALLGQVRELAGPGPVEVSIGTDVVVADRVS
jgi:SAM-dependent methyltransferase